MSYPKKMSLSTNKFGKKRFLLSFLEDSTHASILKALRSPAVRNLFKDSVLELSPGSRAETITPQLSQEGWKPSRLAVPRKLSAGVHAARPASIPSAGQARPADGPGSSSVPRLQSFFHPRLTSRLPGLMSGARGRTGHVHTQDSCAGKGPFTGQFANAAWWQRGQRKPAGGHA